jgi:TRAP-type mannitol/chloroaromatic compound transport system permease small subunit
MSSMPSRLAEDAAIVPSEHSAAPLPPSTPFGWLVDGLNAMGSIIIAAVMVLMCTDVALRNVANHPVDGVSEMVATSIIMIVFLQLPATLRHGRMSRAEMFIDPFLQRHPAAGRRLRALFSLTGVLACGVIAYATWPMLARAWTGNEFFGVQDVFTFPVWPMRAVVVLGAALAAAQYGLFAWQDWREAGQAGKGPAGKGKMA